MKHYEFIIAGGGLAGLSLALRMADSALRDRSLLIVEPDPKDCNDRTWSFWSNTPHLFEPCVAKTWDRLRVAGPSFEKNIDLPGYRYQMIRALNLYHYARAELAQHPNVSFAAGRVDHLDDGEDQALVTVEGQVLGADWAFDGRGQHGALPDDANGLRMRFRGWELETDEPTFAPGTATFLDFRTPQRGAVRFFYVLPLSERRALIEYTLFTQARLGGGEAEAALRAYLEQTCDVRTLRVLAEEGGSVRLTAQRFPRRLGQRILAIGGRGGLIKPTTGFAFRRIQADTDQIVRALAETSGPDQLWQRLASALTPPARFRLYDALMVDVVERHAEAVQSIFACMFARNPIERVFRFLDEASSPAEELRLIATLPPRLFLQTLLRWALSRRSGPARVTPQDAGRLRPG